MKLFHDINEIEFFFLLKGTFDEKGDRKKYLL